MAKRTCSVVDCEKPYVANGRCRMHYMRLWREVNPDKVKGYPPVDRDEQRERMRRWRAANPERTLAIDRRAKVVNRQKLRERDRQRAKAYPEKFAAKSRKRRAVKAKALRIPYTPEQLEARLSMFPGCWMCGGVADQVDHVKPLARGGADILANLRPACLSCNSAKGAAWPFNTRKRR